jgi:hypothetical protein
MRWAIAVPVLVAGCSFSMRKVSPHDPHPNCTESMARPGLDAVGAIAFAIPAVVGGASMAQGIAEDNDFQRTTGAYVFVPSALVATIYVVALAHGDASVDACAEAKRRAREAVEHDAAADASFAP